MKCASKRLAEGNKGSREKVCKKQFMVDSVGPHEGKYICYLAEMNWLNGLVHI